MITIHVTGMTKFIKAGSLTLDTWLSQCLWSIPEMYGLNWFVPNHNKTKQSESVHALQWRHNKRDGVSNHQPHDCLLNRLFGRRSKKLKTSKFRVTGLCEGNSPASGEFPAQRAGNAENVCIWWRHHGFLMSTEWYPIYVCVAHFEHYLVYTKISKFIFVWNWMNCCWTAYVYLFLSFQPHINSLMKTNYVEYTYTCNLSVAKLRDNQTSVFSRTLLKARDFDGSYSFVYVRDILIQHSYNSSGIPNISCSYLVIYCLSLLIHERISDVFSFVSDTFSFLHDT